MTAQVTTYRALRQHMHSLRRRSRLCHMQDSDPRGSRSPALNIGKIFPDVRRHWLGRYVAVKVACLSSKWQPGQGGHLVQCIPQQMYELRPFPVPDYHKVLQNRFFAWCEVGVCRARCCALSLTPAPGAQPLGNWKGGQHPSEPAQAPRQGHRSSPIPPVTNHDRGVRSRKRL
jgi:hypothetical protein